MIANLRELKRDLNFCVLEQYEINGNVSFFVSQKEIIVFSKMLFNGFNKVN